MGRSMKNTFKQFLLESEDDKQRAIELVNDGKLILGCHYNEVTNVCHITILTDIPATITKEQLVQLMDMAAPTPNLASHGVYTLWMVIKRQQDPVFKEMTLKLLKGQYTTIPVRIKITLRTFSQWSERHLNPRESDYHD